MSKIILTGRCVWHNPNVRPENDFDDDDETQDDYEEVIPETGPQLLTSVANDQLIDSSTRAWSLRLSSNFFKKHTVVMARSNSWPGAYSFMKGKLFSNIYIGWGQKYSTKCYNPIPPPMSFEEFPMGLEITEVEDPSVMTEKVYYDLEVEAASAVQNLDQVDEDDE